MSFAVKGSAAVFRFPNRREKISDRSGLEHFSRRDEFDLGEAESILRSWDPKHMVAVPAGRSFSRSDSSHFTLAAGCEIKCCVSIVIFPLSLFDDFFQLIFAENKIFRFSLEGHRIVSELQDPPCFRDSGRRTFDRFAEFRQRNKWRCPLRKPFCFVEIVFGGRTPKKHTRQDQNWRVCVEGPISARMVSEKSLFRELEFSLPFQYPCQGNPGGRRGKSRQYFYLRQAWNHNHIPAPNQKPKSLYIHRWLQVYSAKRNFCGLLQ